jgi:hypothetical protein
MDSLIEKISKIEEEIFLQDICIVNNHKNLIEKIKYNDDLYYAIKNQIKDNIYRFNCIFYGSIIFTSLIIIFHHLKL